MAKRNTIKRWLLTTAWIAAGAGALVLLVAAMNRKSSKACKEVVIDIKGVSNNYFIDKPDIQTLLENNAGGKLTGKPIESINLRKMEAMLERNIWIKDAELFFDNNQVLYVSIIEREPVARVFSANGSSFYIDSAAGRLPLSAKLSARLPVFTGFPDGNTLKAADSILLKDICHISLFVLQDSFWMAQVSQIDITPQRNFEITPTIGHHIIELGDATDIEKKFNRLYIFYKKVLSRTGFEKYSRINLAFAEQVIGTRRGQSDPVADSVQALLAMQHLASLNIENLKPESVVADSVKADTVAVIKPVAAPVVNKPAAPKPEAAKPAAKTATKPAANNSRPANNNPILRNQPVVPSNPPKKNQRKPVSKPPQKPRAVMEPRSQTNDY
jgi:cell division protein FtsQ